MTRAFAVVLTLALWSPQAFARGEPVMEEPVALDEPAPTVEVEVTGEGDVVVEVAPADEPAPTDEPATTHGSPQTHDVPADDFESEPGLAPGGYYGHGTILERAPPDGHNRIVVGSILVPLGTLATVTSAVGLWLSVPTHCAERLRPLGIETTAGRCQGLYTFNAIRTTYGVLMLGSGATILVLGLVQRERYRKWRLKHGMQARPRLGPGLRIRF